MKKENVIDAENMSKGEYGLYAVQRLRRTNEIEAVFLNARLFAVSLLLEILKDKFKGDEMISLERLKEILDTQFSTPFLPKDDVIARFVPEAKERTLEIRIGRRDIWIDENGNVTGGGTCLT